MADLKQNIQYVKGVAPTKAELLNYLGIYTLEDIITYYPRKYEDRRCVKNIEEIADGEEALIDVVAVSNVSTFRLKRNMTVSKLIVRDETEECLITWFNQPYIKQNYKSGERYKFYGKITRKNGKAEMNSPVSDPEGKNKNTGRIIPVYPTTKKLNENSLRQIVENAISIVDNKLEETIPEYIRKKYNLEEINLATRQIHFPEDFESLKIARNRFVFEELLTMQLALLSLKNEYSSEKRGIKYSKDVHMSDVINSLPFNLTKAQLRVLEEIDSDMESDKPMNRLLQGDVGSGKTIVAMIAAYKAVKNGYQAAIMAPTTILAQQHLENFNKILGKFGVKCELLVSGISKKKKDEMVSRLKKRRNRYCNRYTCSIRGKC